MLILSLTALSALALVTGAALIAFRQWLDLRRLQLDQGHGAASHGAAMMASASQRIDIADLKERMRRLEAIAAGVDF